MAKIRTAVLACCTLVLFFSAVAAQGKRFDCRMFCRATGFNGMVGGCRCSFTLFTSKRSSPTHGVHWLWEHGDKLHPTESHLHQLERPDGQLRGEIVPEDTSFTFASPQPNYPFLLPRERR